RDADFVPRGPRPSRIRPAVWQLIRSRVGREVRSAALPHPAEDSAATGFGARRRRPWIPEPAAGHMVLANGPARRERGCFGSPPGLVAHGVLLLLLSGVEGVSSPAALPSERLRSRGHRGPDGRACRASGITGRGDEQLRVAPASVSPEKPPGLELRRDARMPDLLVPHVLVERHVPG